MKIARSMLIIILCLSNVSFAGVSNGQRALEKSDDYSCKNLLSEYRNIINTCLTTYQSCIDAAPKRCSRTRDLALKVCSANFDTCQSQASDVIMSSGARCLPPGQDNGLDISGIGPSGCDDGIGTGGIGVQ